MTTTRPTVIRHPAVDPTLMVCWTCGYRGALRRIRGRIVVVHAHDWICG